MGVKLYLSTHPSAARLQEEAVKLGLGPPDLLLQGRSQLQIPLPDIKKLSAPNPFQIPVKMWDWWVPHLPKTTSEPQELDILGSVKMKFCAMFNHTARNWALVKNVSPHHATYKNHTFWCNNTSFQHATSKFASWGCHSEASLKNLLLTFV